MTRRYAYVGPGELHGLAPVGVGVVRGAADLDAWLAARDPRELAEPFTFVVDGGGVLRLAPRRSEHVACAGGGDVLAAGEMGFVRTAAGWRVDRVSNQSTGYCPDAAGSWPAVAAALTAAGTPHPGGFTDEVVFRRCTACAARNVVHDGDLVCAVCAAPLPEHWNLGLS
ncbi:hypothetical protein Daura_34030 [Dactylosporangium aurantiacum]|uniref:Uncharacterized protein n=1 Tax=Dactylosporangium aurantiacum TaxID=35754 RepID=A0A9Q9MAD6_9ACTN|nr:hypothetical protein [Dactylosporangium aurantiacum]MDG6105211.1 hypothetical protein [Dactylosporangium aurantiacum]UWZ51728.1 hypothetical protein Daura_34030 [Dactylosporangium aurantiacum]